MAELENFHVISTFGNTNMTQNGKMTWNTPSFECMQSVEKDGCAPI